MPAVILVLIVICRSWELLDGAVGVPCGRVRGDHPERVEQPAEFRSVYQFAEQLGCALDDALALVRRVGPRGVVRTADRRFLILPAAVEQLRAVSSPGQEAFSLWNVIRLRLIAAL